jgi:predicted ATPase/class 3 adenylate cyclase
MSLPTGTVTFLFTDIQGSTQLWQEYPQAMPGALARHHALLRQAIESQDGYVFQIIGDAFCAAFHTALDGVQAALAAQSALSSEPWRETGPIRVRMALHTGSVELKMGEKTSGEYVSGITLSRSARLLSAGHGGQVLLSQATADLLAYELPGELSLIDLGEHRLKDLVRPEHIYQLAAEGLGETFPPLKTLDALPNNLPVQLTSFIGREKALQTVIDLLTGASPTRTRLLTLLGPGGQGKTRLALQASADLIDEFHDGAWFVDLSALSDPALLEYELANTWGLRQQPGQTIHAILVDYLRQKRLLLIMDNCEHLVDSVARLADQLLRAAPGLSILATSRETLNINGETLFRLPALSLPDVKRLPSPEGLTHFEAVRLFLERAQAVRPDFTITTANAPALAQICLRLDGIPLAIELAAARLRAFSLEQINARLEDRFRLLTGGGRTAMPRQQTLQAAVDWSYNLLSPSERAVFRRLGVFAGGWTLEAAEAVCADPPAHLGGGQTVAGQPPADLSIDAYDVLDLLSRLVDKSLVVGEEQPAGMRYHLLDTIQHYARARLQEAPEAVILPERHFCYFLNQAREFAVAFEGPTQLTGLERMQAEQENLRAALRYSLEADLENAIELANALWLFWFSRGYFVEGRAWIERAWEAAKIVPVSSLARSKASYVLASFLYFQGYNQDALEISRQGLALARLSGDRRGELMSLHHLGNCEISIANYPGGIAYFQEGLALARETGDTWAIEILLTDLGIALRRTGKWEEAEKCFQESYLLATRRGDAWSSGYAQGNLAEIALERGDYALAEPLTHAALQIARQFNDGNALEYLLVQNAFLAARRGSKKEALEYLQEAIEIKDHLGRQRHNAEILEAIAIHMSRDSQAERTARLLGAAVALRHQTETMAEKSWQNEINGVQQDVLAQLGEERYATEYQKGLAMSLDEAIRDAAGAEIG